jgi:NADH-quinone oxidoreductase subunit L
MEKLITLVPLFPLVGFLYQVFFGKNTSKQLTTIIGSGAIFASFVVSLIVFNSQLHSHQAVTVKVFEWIHAGSLHIDLAFLVDSLSSTYLLFITGVGFLIHIYSSGYMSHDEGFNRFFAYLNLFVFFMLILVLGDSLVTLFVGWEGVGVCSFMLIGFWYKEHANNEAAKKAFIMNRVGDLGLIVAMILIFSNTGTLNYVELFNHGKIASLSPSMLTTIAIFLFIGAMGKSAQFPLHTWLPDAMAGPTPVSALIHAATMVTAGIYLVARNGELFEMSHTASNLVLYVGLITALMGATIALTQNDIKKVLAYSTVSQLGFMFVALGMGAHSIAVFHVITHAFFKALLFLGSGSVIHGMGGEQDIRRMGGLKKYMPSTQKTFLIGTLAIAGIFPFAGFFSKDQILAHAMEHNMPVFILLVIASACTAFYMFRMYYLTFHGKFRGTHDQEHHLHESPASMTIPLWVLAVLSVVGGFIGFPHALGHTIHFPHALDHFLEGPVLVAVGDMTVTVEIILALATMGIAVVMIYVAHNIYIAKSTHVLEDNEITSPFHKLLHKKYGFDELYEALFKKPANAIGHAFSTIVEWKIIDGIVNAAGTAAEGVGSLARKLHGGHIAGYLLTFMIGLIILLSLIFKA